MSSQHQDQRYLTLDLFAVATRHRSNDAHRVEIIRRTETSQPGLLLLPVVMYA